MTDKVTICNLALAHLGDRANITAIDPPDGSAQAMHCAMFYPIALQRLLVEFPPRFAITRAALAALTNDVEAYAFKYQYPSDCLKPMALFQEGAIDESVSEHFTREGDSIYTDVENATLRYVQMVDDAAKYPPMFVDALSYMLASYLVGPLRKDAKMKTQMYQLAMVEARKAAAEDAGNEKPRNLHVPAHLRVRGITPGPPVTDQDATYYPGNFESNG